MNNKDFMQEVVDLYKIAKKSTEKFQIDKIKRGRNHSISSVVEDLLAFFIVKRSANTDFELWVDYPVSYKTSKKLTKKGNWGTKTNYPDIAVAKRRGDGKYIITHIIDLKMDLGWKRDFVPTVNNAITAVRDMRSILDGTYKTVDSEGRKSKTSTNIEFSPDLKWHIVVISDTNINSDDMKKAEDYARQEAHRPFLELYVFSRDVHPNNGNPNINEKDMNDLISSLAL